MTTVAISTLLATARWPRRAPAAAILLWQALGLGWGLAAVGTLAALAAIPAHTGVAGGVFAFASSAVTRPASPASQGALPETFRLIALAMATALLAMLCWVLAAAGAAALRTRRRHRTLL